MSWFFDLLKDIPLSTVLKERLALAEQKFKDLESQNSELKTQVEQLTTQNASLAEQIADFRAKEDSVIVKPKLEGELYTFAGEAGLFCTTCWDTKKQKIRPTKFLQRMLICPICKTKFGR